jgi:hypothetical protein
MTEGELRQSALAYDLWSYSTFATLLPRADRRWVVVHGSDHGVTFFDDRASDVETYLEFVLACLGQCNLRYRTFNAYHAGKELPSEGRERGEGLVVAGRDYWQVHPFSTEALLTRR